MKNKLRLLTFLCVPFLLVGCSSEGEKNTDQNNTGDNNNNNNNNGNGQGGEEQTPHTHDWEENWSSNGSQHWHKCKDRTCKEKKDAADHEFGEWVIDSYAHDVTTSNPWGGNQTTTENGSKHRVCSVCNYRAVTDVTDYDPSVFDPLKVKEPTGPYESKFERDYKIFDTGAPEIRFTLVDDPVNHTTGTEFATQPRKSSHIEGWEVNGRISTTNCADKFKLTNVEAGMKVRGNYTTDYAKKGFRIKFNTKTNLFGLNGGQKYKKWVMFGEVKDNAMLRNSLAFYLARSMVNDNIFVSDFTPAHLYINNQYWGLYLLAEQKEAKEGRIFNGDRTLGTQDKNYTDISYAFELDRYATEEEAKEDGDPVFRVNYTPQIQYNPHPGENRYQCNGFINTYTMLSDLTHETEQLAYISKRVENTYKVLYYAGQNQLKEIVNEEVVNSSETDMEKCLEKSIDIDSFVDFYILNELACDPDIGYSSFYLAFDNSDEGDKRLRMDCPWDFDSAFGVRANTVEDSQGLFASKSSNMWFSMICKLNFFKNRVKEKWNKIREDKVLEKALNMLEDYSINYVNEYKKNYEKWNTMGSNPETNHETRAIVQKLKSERQAEQLLYHWFGDRVDYLETVYGNNRASILNGTPIENGGNNGGNNDQPNNNQPVDYTSYKASATKARLEAEAATLDGNCKVKTKENEGISGNSYVGDLNPSGGSVTFTYNATKAGEALLSVGLSQRPQEYKLTDLFDITVNNNAFTGDVVIPAGNGTDFHMWTVIDAGKINLNLGNNTIVFTAKQTSTNFDFIDLYIPN